MVDLAGTLRSSGDFQILAVAHIVPIINEYPVLEILCHLIKVQLLQQPKTKPRCNEMGDNAMISDDQGREKTRISQAKFITPTWASPTTPQAHTHSQQVRSAFKKNTDNGGVAFRSSPWTGCRNPNVFVQVDTVQRNGRQRHDHRRSSKREDSNIPGEVHYADLDSPTTCTAK